MSAYKYIGDEARDYNDLDGESHHVEPGDVLDLKKDPGDGRWKAVAKAKAVKKTTKNAIAMPDVTKTEDEVPDPDTTN